MMGSGEQCHQLTLVGIVVAIPGGAVASSRALTRLMACVVYVCVCVCVCVVCRICCACPETKKIRDQCLVKFNEDKCAEYIEAHKICLRKEGFNV